MDWYVSADIFGNARSTGVFICYLSTGDLCSAQDAAGLLKNGIYSMITVMDINPVPANDQCNQLFIRGNKVYFIQQGLVFHAKILINLQHMMSALRTLWHIFLPSLSS